MKNKWDVEMSYILGISVVAEGDTKEEAVTNAKELVKEYVSVNDGFTVDCGDVMFEQVNFIQEHR
jgi:predicted RNase H-like HicB family nuclease